MDLEKTIRNLESRGFRVSHFADSEEAAAYIVAAVSGKSVGIGGSKTVEALGLYDKLSGSSTVYWHWKVPGRDTLKNAALADVYLSSANAVSEDGEILNIDGTGNRLAGTLFGHEKVWIIAGTNKIAPDFDAALKRARNEAAVKNCARFGKKTPCQLDGTCHDCRSQDRICKALTVLWGPMNGMETEVVLIDGDFGF